MPISASAKKSLRASEKKRLFNDRRRKTMRLIIKDISDLVKEGKISEAKNLLPNAYKAIDKAEKRGVLKPNTASRKKSLLSRTTKEVK
jgi:small subunit ribosomal protein S20